MLLKESLVNFSILVALDFPMPFPSTDDASNIVAGALLMQEEGHGMEYLVCCFSKMFTALQRNYSVIEKELLAMILALQHFTVYVPVFGPCVTIYSDHHPMKYLCNLKTKNQCNYVH